MPRTQPVEQLALLEIVLRRFPKGASVGEVSQFLAPKPDPRTVLRWLLLLVEQRRALQIEFGEDPRFANATPPDGAAAAAAAPAGQGAATPNGGTPADAKGPGGLSEATATQAANGANADAGNRSDATPLPIKREEGASLTATDFPRMFAEALPQLILTDPSKVTEALQLQASRNQLPLELRLAYVKYSRVRLETLTPAEAESFGVTAESFAAWQAKSASTPAPAPTAPSPNAPPAETPSTPVPTSTAAAKTPEDPEDPVVHLVIPATPPQSAVTPPAHPEAHPAAGKSETAHPENAEGHSVKPEDVIDLAVSAFVSHGPAHSAAKLATKSASKYLPAGVSPAVAGALLVAAALLAIGAFQFIATSSVATKLIAGAVLGVGTLAFIWVRSNRRDAETPGSEKPKSGNTEGPRSEGRAGRSKVLRWAAWGVAAVLVVAGVGLGAMWYRRAQQRPSEAAISAHLVRALAPVPVRVAALAVTYESSDAAGCTFSYRAQIELAAPLYRRVDTESYLHEKHPSEMAEIDAAITLLRGREGDRLRTAVPAAASLPLVDQWVLITTETPPRRAAISQGRLNAYKQDDGQWIYQGDTIHLDRSRLVGDVRPKGDDVFAVDVPSEEDRLSARLTEVFAVAERTVVAARSAKPNAAQGSSGVVPAKTYGTDATSATGAEADKADTPVQRKAETLFSGKADTLTTDMLKSGAAEKPAAGNAERPKEENPKVGSISPGDATASSRGDSSSATGAGVGKAETLKIDMLKSGGGNTGDATPSSRVAPAVGAGTEKADTLIFGKAETLKTDMLKSDDAASRTPALDSASSALPAFPTKKGGYVLVDGGWTVLPRNHAHPVQSTAQKALAALSSLNYRTNKLAGRSPESTDAVAEIVFDGMDTPPAVSGKGAVVVFVGPLAPLTEAQLKAYPELKTYPIIELAPMRMLSTGERYAELLPLAPGIVGFGKQGVEGTIETPKKEVTVLRCKRDLEPGFYALACGELAYELVVQ